MKLKSKFLLFTLPMILLPLFVVSSLSYLYLKETIHRFSIIQLDSTLLQLGSDTISRLDTAASNAMLISQNAELNKYVVATEQNKPQLNDGSLASALMEIIKVFPRYSEIAVFSQNGVLLESISETFKESRFQTAFVQQMIESRQDHHAGVWVQDNNGKIYYLVAHAMKKIDAQNQYIKNRVNKAGYLFISMDMGFLNELVREGVEQQGIDYFITNPQGDVIYSPSASLTADTAELSETSSRLTKIISSRSSSINHYEDGESSYYGGYKRLTRDLYLVGFVEEDKMLFSSATFKMYITWFALAVLLISFVLIRLQVNSLITNPVDILRRLITKLKAGKYEHDMSLLGSNELCLLAEDIKALSQGLSESSETVKNLAYYDSLTGLPNRITFDVHLSKAIKQCQRTNAVLGLLFIDLDNFKNANDIYGHQVGDELLKEAAKRLESCLRSADVVSRKAAVEPDWGRDIVVRLGGDEFTIILTDIEQAHQASMVAQRVVEVLSHPFDISGAEINIGASIGIAMYPVDGTTADRLIKSADLAMYEAKQKGRNNYKFFTKALNEAVAKRLEVESLLREAIKNDEFFIVFQPKVRVKDGVVVGAEALVRWRNPNAGILLPAQFISVAEESGISIEIGRLVIKKVCQQLQQWEAGGLGSFKVSINLSSLQLLYNGVVDDFKDALKCYDINARNLEIELNESVLIADERSCIDLLNQFKILGIESALDNFGSGNLSLDFVRKFPIKHIKFDRSYLDTLEDSSKRQVVLDAMLTLARALSFEVVVEGVETEAQLKIIQGMSCDYVQGYYFTEPLIASELKFKYVIPSLRRNHINS